MVFTLSFSSALPQKEEGTISISFLRGDKKIECEFMSKSRWKCAHQYGDKSLIVYGELSRSDDYLSDNMFPFPKCKNYISYSKKVLSMSGFSYKQIKKMILEKSYGFNNGIPYIVYNMNFIKNWKIIPKIPTIVEDSIVQTTPIINT